MSPPDHTEAAHEGALPVNIAPPNWQCPHCLTKYGSDLTTATACAEAPPAPPVTEGAPVLVLSDGARYQRSLRFGVTQVGRTKAVRAGEGAIRHQRDVVVSGKALTESELAGAIHGADDLLIIASEQAADSYREYAKPALSSYTILARMFLGENGFDWRGTSGVKVWIDEHALSNRYSAWLNAPDEQQRSALNTATSGLLDRIVETETTELAEKIRGRYAPASSRNRSSMTPADVVAPGGGLMLALAHGATNHIWGLRWLNTHLEPVTQWQARTLRDWARGDGGPIPVGTYLRAADSLPKNPGKRRLAVMEPYGDDYQQVLNTIVNQLTTDALISPVPNVEDVEQTMRPTNKEDTAHV